MFKYNSNLVLSKSWINRALIIQFYQSKPKLAFDSDSEDVKFLKNAIAQIGRSSTFFLGEGGTSFRFFCLLISRHPGEWTVQGNPRLLERPQKSLKEILNQIGVDCEFYDSKVTLKSKGWEIPQKITFDARESSQFASALILNSWGLKKKLHIEIIKPITSLNYLKMTFLMLEKYGLKYSLLEDEQCLNLQIDQGQLPAANAVIPEVDISSAFSLASAAVINGEVKITNWETDSIQPDVVFLNYFKKMKINFEIDGNILTILKHKSWDCLTADLGQSPDLFPVLCVLCALALGTSNLYGAKQLQFKESNRLLKTKELLDLVGFRSELKEDGIIIHGQSSILDKKLEFKFDPDNDHRMAMAAGLLKLAGYNIHILQPEVVQKSYPKFWHDIQVVP